MTDAVTEQTLMRLKEHGGQASAAVFVAAEGLGFEVFKRLRATAGQGPNYVGPFCGYMLAYVGLMLTHVEPKDPKNGNSKKTL